MSFFKEIFALIKMLFTSINIKEVETMPMKCFPFPGYKYMMWCGKLIYRENHPEWAKLNSVDKNHESIHLQQAKDCGSWFVYYISYLWNWIKEKPYQKPFNSAYYTNKYEVEAYAKEQDLTYLSRRKPNMVDKYKLLYGKKIYKNYGSSYKFKEMIREMFSEY